MDFSEAQRVLDNLNAGKLKGDISVQHYTAELNQLRVQDTSGRWWQPDPLSGGWLVWNGTTWQQGIPPAPDGADDKKLMDMQEFREISRTLPWHRRPQKWWDLFSILGGCVSAVIWFLYSGVRSNIEGFDLISPILMIGIPVFMVTYRTQLDDMLIPLQPHRKQFPKLVLVGAGIAVPFLTAFLLYNLFSVRQYPLMQWNMIIGTFTAYAITREPILAKGYQAAKGISLKVPLLLVVGLSLLVRIVGADDCIRDPLNARDCLRTQGYAEVITGTASAAASTAINGPEIVRTLIQQQPPASPPGGSGPAGGGGTPPPLTPEEIAEEAQRQADETRRLAEWQAQNEAGWQKFVEKGREGMTQNPETGDWMSHSVAQDVAREQAVSTLQQDLGRRLNEMRDQILFGPHLFDQTRSDVMTRAIDGLLDQVRNGQQVSMEQYDRLRAAYGNDIMGNTLPPHQTPPVGDNWSEILTDTVQSSTREILTGKDTGGNASYSSMALRAILGGVTGGQSEWVYTPGSSVYDMQEYVDKGGNSVLEAWRRSAAQAVTDEATGRIVDGALSIGGHIGERMLDKLAERYPGKAEWIAGALEDTHEFFTRERHLGGSADDAARAAAGSGDDVARAVTGSGDDAAHAVSGSADDTARAASGQADDAARTVSDAGGGGLKPVDEIPHLGERTKLKDEIRERIERLQNQRTQGGKDLPQSFEPVKSKVSPDEVLRHGGITPREQELIKSLGRDNPDAVFHVRPRGEHASHLIETNQALPKGPELHVKTVKGDAIQEFEMGGMKMKQTKYNPEVEHLGYDPKNKDLLVFRKPDPLPPQKPPDMSSREWRELRQAHAERMSEYINERPKIQELVDTHKITIDSDGLIRNNGLVPDAETGKPFTSDLDLWGIGSKSKPGHPVAPEVELQIRSDPRAEMFLHGGHEKFPVGEASRQIPAGAEPGTLSPFDLNRRIDHRVIESAANPGKGLISIDGAADTVDIVRYTGPMRFPHGLPD